MSQLAIELATDAASRAAVFRFRYDIYVTEMRRAEPDADHVRRWLSDDLDAWALIVVARDAGDGGVVGTVRVNLLRDGHAGYYERFYRLHELSTSERQRSAITTRMMVASTWRGSRLGLDLAKAAYRIGQLNAVTHDRIDCNSPMVPFFTRLGYLETGRARHPVYGDVHLMTLALQDRAHLESVRSPFRGMLADLSEPITTVSDTPARRRQDDQDRSA